MRSLKIVLGIALSLAAGIAAQQQAGLSQQPPRYLKEDLCPDPEVTVTETTGCTAVEAQDAFSQKADNECKDKCPKNCEYFGYTNPSCQTVSSPRCENRLGFWCPTQKITCVCIPER